jgi:hypothetical protein
MAGVNLKRNVKPGGMMPGFGHPVKCFDFVDRFILDMSKAC